MVEELVPRDLYGGALTIALPARFVDVSQWRQVPDHQEVFADQDTDESFVIEINELVADVDDAAAAQHHFNDLAAANDATSSSLITVEAPFDDAALVEWNAAATPRHGGGGDTFKAYCCGEQVVNKFGKADAERVVGVHLLLLRVRSVTSDVLVTFNGAAERARTPDEHAGVAAALVRPALASFAVRKWGLFTGEEE
jgi:hypothetical protein